MIASEKSTISKRHDIIRSPLCKKVSNQNCSPIIEALKMLEHRSEI